MVIWRVEGKNKGGGARTSHSRSLDYEVLYEVSREKSRAPPPSFPPNLASLKSALHHDHMSNILKDLKGNWSCPSHITVFISCHKMLYCSVEELAKGKCRRIRQNTPRLSDFHDTVTFKRASQPLAR